MSFVNLTNRNQVLNLPATTVASLTIQNANDGILTSSNGTVSSISAIDTSNLSISLQTRLNTIESNQSLSLGITDVSGLDHRLTKIDASLNTLGISNISGLQTKIDKIDASLNTLSSGGSSSVGISDVSGLSIKLTSIDSSLNILTGISNSLLSGNSVNVSNFASSWSQLTNSPQDKG